MHRFLISLPLILLSSLANSAIEISDPAKACRLLKELGFNNGDWKQDYEDSFFCSSPYVVLGKGTNGGMANNIAYYIEGSHSLSTEAKLVLNINNRNTANSAHRELLKAGNLLSQKLISAQLPNQVSKAIIEGKNITHTINRTQIELIRINWDNGNGYELKLYFK